MENTVLDKNSSIEVITSFIESMDLHIDAQAGPTLVKSSTPIEAQCHSIKESTMTHYVSFCTKKEDRINGKLYKHVYLMRYGYARHEIKHLVYFYQSKKPALNNFIKLKYGSDAFYYIEILENLSKFMEKKSTTVDI